jgi:ketosteroid isomerase-like protein
MTRMLKIALTTVGKAVGAAGAVLLAAACASGGAYVAPPAEATAIRIESLLEADRAFAARAAEVGPSAAFADFMAADGKLLGAADEPIVGTEAIAALMASLPETAEISWTPLEAMVSASGEFGVTWGEYRLAAPGENGVLVEETGRYLTVWRKDEQGRWRGVLDIGT